MNVRRGVGSAVAPSPSVATTVLPSPLSWADEHAVAPERRVQRVEYLADQPTEAIDHPELLSGDGGVLAGEQDEACVVTDVVEVRRPERRRHDARSGRSPVNQRCPRLAATPGPAREADPVAVAADLHVPPGKWRAELRAQLGMGNRQRTRPLGCDVADQQPVVGDVV